MAKAITLIKTATKNSYKNNSVIITTKMVQREIMIMIIIVLTITMITRTITLVIIVTKIVIRIKE